ncbi:hypothetical protein AAII07_50235 [Microvirga sp. 0TCS3.31]
MLSRTSDPAWLAYQYVTYLPYWNNAHDFFRSTVSLRSIRTVIGDGSHPVCRRIPIDDRSHGARERDIGITRLGQFLAVATQQGLEQEDLSQLFLF